MEIGLAYIDNEATESSLGVSSDQTVNGRTAAQALYRGINAEGGLHGRELQPVEYSWDTSSNSFHGDATEACEKFTSDHHVEVVLDAAFGTIGGFGDCLQQAGVLHLTRGTEGDRVSSQQRTLHANTQSMIDDRTYAAVLTNLAATGNLGSDNQLGIILEDCPTLVRAYDDTILPLISELGLAAPETRTTACVTGFGDAGPAASETSGAVLAFRQASVDRVMFMSDYESVLLLMFANAASSQAYRPGYALSSNAQPEPLRQNIPSDQWPQLHGVGNSPGGDVADPGEEPSPVEKRCLQLAAAGGLTTENWLDTAFVHAPCGLYLLLEAALADTNGNSAPTALVAAIDEMGTAFAAPGIVGNRTRFSASHRDGPNAVRVFGFDADCECMRYRGQPLPAPAWTTQHTGPNEQQDQAT